MFLVCNHLFEVKMVETDTLAFYTLIFWVRCNPQKLWIQRSGLPHLFHDPPPPCLKLTHNRWEIQPYVTRSKWNMGEVFDLNKLSFLSYLHRPQRFFWNPSMRNRGHFCYKTLWKLLHSLKQISGLEIGFACGGI